MSEQPIQEQEQPEETVAPGTDELEDMGNYFYHVRVMDIPDHEKYMHALALFRSIVDGSILTEWYNPQGGEWEDAPEMIALTGVGGDEDYVEISGEDAAEVKRALDSGETIMVEFFNPEQEQQTEAEDTTQQESIDTLPFTQHIKKKSLTVSPVFGIIRGGPGSGNWGHQGLDNVWGGSSSTGGGKAKKTNVGITSSRPGKEEGKVFSEMDNFRDALQSIKTVKDATVEPGTGGWEGGSEPTWVVSYEGNGEALKLLAETGKQYEQNAILVYESCEGEGCSPAVDWLFKEPISLAQKSTIEELLVENGIGGWTWYQKGGAPVLRAVAVPQWGGERDAHLLAADKIGDSLNAAGIGFDRSDFDVSPIVMEQEGDYAYDNYLR